MTPAPARRRSSPGVAVAVDVFRAARASRRWLLLIVLVLGALAAFVAGLAQVLPWLIYPAL